MDTGWTQVDTRIRAKACTVVWKEEECLPYDSPVMSYKREGASQSSGQIIRVDGTEKKR